MVKGEDAVLRKKNKKLRKKNNSSSSSVSAKVAAVIAAKKRRKAGKRRMCQGMCFSLPTPEDPFNDRGGKEEFQTKGPKKNTHLKSKPIDEMVRLNEKSGDGKKGAVHGRNIALELQRKKEFVKANNDLGQKRIINSERKKFKVTEMAHHPSTQRHDCDISEFPSKFVFWCLSSIENALRHGDAYTDGEGNSFFLNPWGLEFLKCYSTGKDLMETSGTSATTEQIAWTVSSAADTFSRKEREGLSFAGPFLLFLVPSQEKAVQVRTVCKPLKSVGIHTVSIHPGASLDHQIQGMKTCEPEFLVSTPERLLELVSVKAIDISGISMLVIDGLNAICNAGHTDTLKSIKKCISGNPHMVIFNDCHSHLSIPVVQYLLTGSICRLSLNNSITSLSSCTIQSVTVCSSEEDKVIKSVKALDQFQNSRTQNSNMLYILRKDVKCHKLLKILKSKGCSICIDSDSASLDDSVDSDKKEVVSAIALEHISTTDIGTYDVVILPSFVPSIDTYVHILTNMARQSAKGVLYSFLTKRDRELASALITVLEQCGQEVPQTLLDLHHSSNMVED
ncbi:pre-mRNA-processing ATP-dependent RNA helicase prp5 [Vigna radiata var. radiata]|uniref:Pre-mRNA-processing ATP-dependent RNA helicase prp5 n=1 Tax=Vigna radiata var. radiata TaxID=3916 RepID=A0A1S3UXT5_VIGRR|nr:pre-mRNA-processing ATP-dependent RNA helicase prp5 [Vigna radiata var. radiata]